MAITPEAFDAFAAQLRAQLFPMPMPPTPTPEPVPTPAAPAAPIELPAPTGITATAGVDRRVSLTCHAYPQAVAYQWWEASTAGRPVATTDRPARLSGPLAPGTYVYSVSAVVPSPSDDLETPVSEPVSVVVSEPVPPLAPAPDPAPAPVPIPTPAPVPPVVTKPASGLSEPPPALVDPLHIQVPVTGGNFKGFSGRDVVLHLPTTPVTGSITTYGGHHVAIQGGALHPSGRCIAFQHAEGDTYLEGVEIGHPGGTSTEGINWSGMIQKPGSRRVVQNCIFNPLSGSRDTNHSDGAQDWSGNLGVATILANCEALDVIYQWLMFQPTQYGVQPQVLRLRDLVLAHRKTTNGYLLFFTSATPKDWDRVDLYTDNPAGSAVYPKGLADTEKGLTIRPLAQLAQRRNVLVGAPGVGYVPPVPLSAAA